jgi:tetratricopeptide (TPR) repeat protein
MERHYWQPIEQLAERFPDTFAGDPLLLYRLAEAQLQLGKRELADETAKQAMSNVPDAATEHTLMAFRLAERGMFSWAEREYRRVMELAEAGSPDDIRSRLLLSEMLHDLENDLEAAKVLEPVVEAFDKNPSAVQFVQQVFRREPGSVKSRMHYFYAANHARTGDAEKQREALDRAVASDPTDADVLIAMYHLPNPDEEWRERTHKQIDAAVGHFRDQINAFQLQAEHAPNEQIKAWYEERLAGAHNQLAWLVGNTEGDFDEAVRSSRASLEIRPEAGGYFDTLARCYYAKGDYENAVESQRKAVKLEPHSGQIVRQLELFEKALAESREKAP